jgi:predicted nucleic acid-binding protein
MDCATAARDLRGPMLVTWPVLSEAMFLLRRSGGWVHQQVLWNMIHTGVVALADLDSTAVRRVAELMRQYRNVPMSLADASLVAVAEARGLRTVFTLDSDFHVYRVGGRKYLKLVPATRVS